MRRKQLWLVIAALVMLNCLTVIFFLSKTIGATGTAGMGDVVASVSKESITRQEWLDELEARYGKDVLQDMIDQKVIQVMAAKYKIHLSDQDINREMRMLQTTNNSQSKANTSDEKKWKEQIRNSLLLEEILTKDVVISDKELKSYYQKNKDLFDVPTAYHLSQIIVKTKNEAKKTLNELSQGSSFSALAMERSIDEFSANEGGDIGYVSAEDDRYPADYIQTAKKLKTGAYSSPLKVEHGYAILKLEGKVNGKAYSYTEVKTQIRRQMALEQMNVPASARSFWNEAKVEWLYGDKDTN